MVISVLPHLQAGVAQAIRVVSYPFIISFLVINRRLSGLKLILLGTLLNFAAIVANHGIMPARPAAIRSAGIALNPGFDNSAPVAHARLQFLGDTFAVPASMPLSNVFSIGDVLIDLGALVLILVSCYFEPEELEPPKDPELAGTREWA